MTVIRRLNSTAPDFRKTLANLLAWESVSDEQVFQSVRDIVASVRSRGDAAVVEYTNRFDRMNVAGMQDLIIDPDRMQHALQNIPVDVRKALEHAAERLRTYAERQKMKSWSYTEEDGTLLGQQVMPLDRVGLYVPGGKATYPSSVLMNAIPAKVARRRV